MSAKMSARMNAKNSLPFAEVIGDPIAQSKSPAIHGFWIEKLGLKADYRAFHVKADEEGALEAYLADRRRQENWQGCNVTMPHKQSVMALLDRLDPVAKAIGAVNTIIREEDGSLTGHNTDAAGFLEVLQEELAQKHLFRMARILGTGGAARAIITALAPLGITMVVAARNPEKARRLLDELVPKGEHHVVEISHFAAETDFTFDDRDQCFDLVVNASPLGMSGQPPLAFDMSHVPPGAILYDIVTAPLDTRFLVEGAMAGFKTLDGLNMLIGQAAIAFEKFFGSPPPREDCDRELRAILQK